MKTASHLISKCVSIACTAGVLLSGAAHAQAPARPELYVVRDVRLVDQADAPHVSLVLEGGRVTRVLEAGAAEPAGARAIDGKGQLAVPAFIDAYSYTGCTTPQPSIDRDLPPSESTDVQVDMREANRKGISPSFRCAVALDIPKDKAKSWRESGFGALLSSPHGQILSGTSALAVTREAAARDAILLPDVFTHAAFRATGPGYPSTLMGYTAQLRQFVLDAQYQQTLTSRVASGKSGPRPPFDPELDSVLPILKKQRRLACEAETERDVERWIRLSDELGFDLAIVGGRDAWKDAAELAKRKIPVILTLEWGEEPEDPHAKDKEKKEEKTPPKAGEVEKPAEGAKPEAPKTEAPKPEPPKSDAPKTDAPKTEEKKQEPAKPAEEKKPESGEAKKDEPKPDEKKTLEYKEPLGVKEEKRRLWEEKRDGAKKLHDAGVVIAFGTGSSSASDLLGKLRKMVEAGLPKEVAMAALSRDAATILGASRIGALEVGKDASFGLWTANPMTKDAKLGWLVVDGFVHEFEIDLNAGPKGKPDDGVQATGEWAIEYVDAPPNVQPATLKLTMTPDGEVTGTLITKSPRDQSEVSGDIKGHVGGKKMQLNATLSFGQFNVEVRLEGEINGNEFEGEATRKGGRGETTMKFKGKKKPQ